jgi:phosphocarrier protein
MPERRVVVVSPVGLHARPAAVFVRAAYGTGVEVTIAKPGSAPADARSLLAVMALDVQHGDEVVLSAVGDRSAEALDELAALLATDLDADEAQAGLSRAADA